MTTESVWLRDVDGTGSMHPCHADDEGAVEYQPVDTEARISDTEFAMSMLSQFAETEAGNTAQTIVLTLAWAALHLIPSHQKRQVTMKLDDLQALQHDHVISQGWDNRGVTVSIERKKSPEVTSEA